MAIYGSSQLSNITESVDIKALVEDYILDDVMRGTEDQIKEFVQSETAQVLMEKQVLRKKSLMRLDASDDLARRKKLTAFELAKQANDPLWTQLKKNRVQEKKLVSKIMKKYGNKAEKVAKVAQKDYIKAAKKLPNTPEKK